MGRRYTLTQRTEEGALAEMFKATAEGPGPRDVLIKLFTPKATDPIYGKALAEVSARARALNHPQVVAYEEIGNVGDRLAAVRPFVDGYNLGEALKRLASKEVVCTPALALYIVVEAAQIIGAAHAQGWLHGAITPGNILLGRDGKVRIADFGALEAMSASPALKQLVAKGRHAYRAPELKQPGAGGPAADVYSLGAIIYELLTLREVASVRGGGLSTKRDGLQAPSRCDRRLNARIDPPVMRALEPAATRRFKNGQEMADSLRGLFTVLGYAPSQNELVKFVRELFPNEVSVGGVGGPPPFTNAFSLSEIKADGTYEPVAFVAPERVSYTSSELPAVSLDDEPVEQLPSEPVAAAAPPAAPAPTKSFDDWEAPPGAMPELPKLARNRQPAPTVASPAPTMDAIPSAASDTGESPAVAEPEKPARRRVERRDTVRVPDVGFDFADFQKPKDLATQGDWHPPPPVPQPPPPKPKIGMGAWMVAILACGAAALLAFMVVGKHLGFDTSSMLKDAAKSGAEVVVEESAGARAVQPISPVEADMPAKAQKGLASVARVSLTTDTPAHVYVDGVDIGETTPLNAYAMQPGHHALKLVSVKGNVERELALDLKTGEHQKLYEFFNVAAEPKAPVKTQKGMVRTTKKGAHR